MAAASQAVPGEFDSRHLLQKSASRVKWLVDFVYYANYLYQAKKWQWSIDKEKMYVIIRSRLQAK